MEMTEHKKALAMMCRICASFKFTSKDLSKVETYRTELLVVYQLDINDDDHGVHPSTICSKCRSAMQRAYGRVQKGKVFTGKLTRIEHFIAHQPACSACSRFAQLTSSLLPPVVTSAPSTSAASISSDSPDLDTTTRRLFVDQVPDPGFAVEGRRKRIWNAKTSLAGVRRDYGKKRVKEADSLLTSFCEEHKEVKTDVLYFLLTENLWEMSDDRYQEILSSWRKESTGLTPDECLGMRIATKMTKNQYKKTHNILKKRGQIHLTAPHILDELEKLYMPGSARFQLEGDGDVVYHTPVKQGSANVVPEYGQVSYEPIDLTTDFHYTDMPTPNFKAVAWPYIHAVAKTLEELDEDIERALLQNGFEAHDQEVLIHTTLKDGADGMGDVSIFRERSDRLLPDKAFRAAFTVLSCQVDKDGELITLYEPENPNSVLVCRPILEAIGDENNRASAGEMVAAMEKDRELLRRRELRVYMGENRRRRHRCKVFNSMIDEKYDRSAGGLQGSGSRYMCTLCYATKESGKTDLGSFTISRSRDETAYLAKYTQVNPDNLSAADLGCQAKGVKSIPILLSEPKQRLIDATHADINMGSFLKKMIILEMARLQTWDVTADVKDIFRDHEKRFLDHIRAKLGNAPTLMMPGNQARLLFDSKNEAVLLELIDDDARRKLMSDLLALFRRLRSVYRATHPCKEATSTYKRDAIQLGQLLLSKFSYVSWPNYLHKIMEHVQEIIEDPEGPGSVGAISGEGNEAANKLFRELRAHFSRSNRTTDSLRDVIWFHWLYTSPKLRRMAEVSTRKYMCRNCLQQGHNTLHCPNKE